MFQRQIVQFPADTDSILNKWKQFSKSVKYVSRESGMHTEESYIPEPIIVEIEIVIEKLKKHKSQEVELIQANRGKVYMRDKLIFLIWNKEKLSQN